MQKNYINEGKLTLLLFKNNNHFNLLLKKNTNINFDLKTENNFDDLNTNIESSIKKLK